MNIAEAKEQIKDTIEAYLTKDERGDFAIPLSRQRPVFLLGAPGIGKTAIMEQIAGEMEIGLVSYSMTHHTRQSALGLPMIVQQEYEGFEYSASEYTMSEIIAALYDYMRTTGFDSGILFLDEINCVSETLYPSMLQFLQFKTFGKHRIPDNWVVVCAGNPPEYNKSVHEFDIVTLDRLRKVEVEPDYESWKAYALSSGIHPAIVTFLDIRRDCFYSVESSPEGKVFVTARGWNDLSETITLFEKLGKRVDLGLISQFLQKDEVAQAFSQYYDLFDKYRSDYQVEKILTGEASQEVCLRAQQAEFDERLALLGLMLDSLCSSMADVLFEEKVLVELRNLLRDAKDPMLAGGRATDVLGGLLAKSSQRLERIEKAGPGKREGNLATRDANERARQLVMGCKLSDLQTGSEEFQFIQGEFKLQVEQLGYSKHRIEVQLSHGFDFIESVFGNDREMLAFVAELTGRRIPALYINRFGSNSYFDHNEGVVINDYQQDLFNRIDDLGLGDVKVAEKEGIVPARPEVAQQLAPEKSEEVRPVAEEETDGVPADLLSEYYAGAQFEFGLPSLCKMILPDNLNGKTVVDIGCRRGKGVFKLSSRVGETGHAIGIEWSEEYVEEARSKSERASQDSGLAANNMEFHLGYPENLAVAGIADDSIDVIFVNSVVNLAYNPEAAFKEMKRVLKPGGIIINQTVLADRERDENVVQQAKAIGNSVQAAPSKRKFESMLAGVGFGSVSYSNAEEVLPTTGALPQRPADTVDVEEDVNYTALVATIVK